MNELDRNKMRVPAFFYSGDLLASRRTLLNLFEASAEKREQSLVSRNNEIYSKDFAEEVRDAFSGRCAFCEEPSPGAPMRMRPDTEAEPVLDRSISHLYYSWLATSWDNWYWVCNTCRPRNDRHFPLTGSRAKLPMLDEILRFCNPSAAANLARPRKSDFRVDVPVSWSRLQGRDSRSINHDLIRGEVLSPVSSLRCESGAWDWWFGFSGYIPPPSRRRRQGRTAASHPTGELS